jgi:hypothetical protein
MEKMRKREILLIAVLMIILFGLLMSNQDMHGIKKYDCSIAEISPDYPLQVKEACRNMRAERYKQ